MRTLLSLVLTVYLPALAQSSGNSEPTFQSKVTLVTVPVVVRDRQGRAVGNLTKDDFQLFDKGKPRTISRFAIEKTNAPAAVAGELAGEKPAGSAQNADRPIATQFTAYVFDDLNLDSGNLAPVRNAAEKHLSGLAPSARAAIFTTSAVTTLDFTSDQAKLKDALTRLMPRSRTGTKQTDCPYISYYMADLIVNEHDEEALKAGVQEAISCGDHSFSIVQDVEAAAKLMLGIGDIETRTTLHTLKAIVRHVGAMPGQRTVVFVSPGFLTNREHSGMLDIIENAIRLNVTISCLDARGLYLTGQYSDATTRPVHGAEAERLLDQYDRESNSAQSGAMTELAEETGGSFFHNDNGLYEGFQKLAAPPAFLYLLGFSPENLKSDGKFHALKVKLKNGGGLSLQTRRGYFAPRQAIHPAEQAQEEIEGALFSRQEMHDIPITSLAQSF